VGISLEIILPETPYELKPTKMFGFLQFLLCFW